MKISVNGVELNYEVVGSGNPLIMVHGNSEDHTIFTEAAEVLKDHYTCYLVDTRSHGKSSKVKRLHYRDMAQDYMEFIKAQASECNILWLLRWWYPRFADWYGKQSG